MTERALVAVCAATGFLAAACLDSPEAGCPEPCGLGLQCDRATRTCLPLPLPEYERELPGQAARVTSQAGRLWVAAVDPSDGGVVVTEIDGASRDARLLASPPRKGDRRLAIASSPRMVAVAWLGASGAYELAWRPLPGDHRSWNFTTVRTGQAYAGTEDFDLALAGERAPTLVFRDQGRVVRALVSAGPDEPWALEPVDDGGATSDGVTCPDQLRKVRPAAGVGFDPDVAIRGDVIYAAYYDADCGDLRFAQRGAERWSVRVVDAGDASIDAGERGFVGRWPSVAFDPAGAVSIAYHDVSRGQLMFAVERDGAFRTEVVDTGLSIDAFSRERKSIVGAFASLTVGVGGATSIVYFDGTAADLLIARRDAGGADWSKTHLASDGAVGFSAMQVVTSSGARHVVAESLAPAGDGFVSTLVLLEESL